jgi:hypothetical protein
MDVLLRKGKGRSVKRPFPDSGLQLVAITAATFQPIKHRPLGFSPCHSSAKGALSTADPGKSNGFSDYQRGELNSETNPQGEDPNAI